MAQLKTCENCEFQYNSEYNYCPNCGQKNKEILSFKLLFSNTIANYFSVDARFFKSFFPLLVRPGLLPKKFVHGKRLLYLHPAQFYLFISVVFFFLFSIYSQNTNRLVDKSLEKGIVSLDSIQLKDKNDSINIEQTNQNTIQKNNQSEIIKDTNQINTNFLLSNKESLDSAILANASELEKLKIIGYNPHKSSWIEKLYKKQFLKFYEQKGQGFLKTIFSTIPVVMFFILPIFAFILKLLHWRKGSFAHHIVFSFYFFSFVFLFWTLLLIVMLFFKTQWLWFFATILPLVYLWLAIKNFYQQGFWLSLLKTSITFIIYGILLVPIVALVLMASMVVY